MLDQVYHEHGGMWHNNLIFITRLIELGAKYVSKSTIPNIGTVSDLNNIIVIKYKFYYKKLWNSSLVG